MSQTLVPRGRIDLLAQEMLKEGLRMHGNPALRIAVKMCEGQLSQALTETLGPNTPAGKAAQRFIEAAEEFERKFREAADQVRAEDLEPWL